MHQIACHKIYKAATISLLKPLKYTLAVSIKDRSNTSVLVLKSVLSTLSEVLDVLTSMKYLSITMEVSTSVSIIHKYLDNRTCYDKIVRTVLFISRWRIYWYELFSVLRILQKWQNFDETPSLYNIIRGFSPILGIFSRYEILISLECVVDSEWNGVINFIVSCSVVELFTCRNHESPAFNSLILHKTTPLQLCFRQI